MTTAAMWRQMRLIYDHLRILIRWCDGDDEYKRYLQRSVELNQPPVDRGRYFALRLEARYRTTSRCC